MYLVGLWSTAANYGSLTSYEAGFEADSQVVVYFQAYSAMLYIIPVIQNKLQKCRLIYINLPLPAVSISIDSDIQLYDLTIDNYILHNMPVSMKCLLWVVCVVMSTKHNH